jgi:hypothetical protein
MKHQGGDGTVNTAAHSHQHFSFPAHRSENLKRQKYEFPAGEWLVQAVVFSRLRFI